MPEKTAQNALESSSRTGYQAVVIGGGFGGLTAAVRLQAAGVATTLIEQRGQLKFVIPAIPLILVPV